MLALGAGATAQDLKPYKDKVTKKYGYKADRKDKSWAIAPAFDSAKKFTDGTAEVRVSGKIGLIDAEGAYIFPPEYDEIGRFDRNGLCELAVKIATFTKLHGVADRSGQIIIPVQARDVHIDRDGIIGAKYEVAVPGFGTDQLWGVYGMDGSEIFPPQFYLYPSFSGGIGIARSAVNGLYGLVSDTGEVLKPFNYLALQHSSNSYKALGTDFSHVSWNFDLSVSQTLHQPGAIIPYDPMDDPVRAVAWHCGPIGRRLYQNCVKLVQLQSMATGLKAYCSTLPIDWGYGRFVRLEPCQVPEGTADAMYYGEGKPYYTLKALLYEPDGTFVEELSSLGWLEADCSEGIVYNAGGEELWMVSMDPNALAVPSYVTDVSGYRPIQHDNIFNGMGFNLSALTKIRTLYDFREMVRTIYEMENIGLNSYLPPPPHTQYARQERDASRARVFRYAFRMGEVVNCSVRKKDGAATLELSKDLVLRFKDKFDDPSYTMREGEELVFWGPGNARTVGLSLEALPPSDKYTADDLYGTGLSYRFVLSMYDEDGTWLRTLAVAPWIDYIQDGLLVFEGAGIALILPPGLRPGGLGSPAGHGPAGPGSVGGPGSPAGPGGPKGGIPLREPAPHALSAIGGF